MQKRKLFLVGELALALILLTACAGKSTPASDTATPTTPPASTATLASPTATEPAPTGKPTSETVLVDVPAGCSTYALLPTPDARALEAFPNKQAGDWAKGPDTALITLVEYSDFQ